MKFITCNCLTKTPEPKYHKHNCPVWMKDHIDKLERKIKFCENTVKIATKWSQDQSNGLTDGEICVSAMNGIRRILKE